MLEEEKARLSKRGKMNIMRNKTEYCVESNQFHVSFLKVSISPLLTPALITATIYLETNTFCLSRIGILHLQKFLDLPQHFCESLGQPHFLIIQRSEKSEFTADIYL